jgi:hypothetical protein
MFSAAKRARPRRLFAASALLVAAAAALSTGGAAMAIEEPAFELIEKSGAIELRRYAPYVVAETVVEGELGEASSKGFRVIADYIFGNNRSVRAADGAQKIEMTAPVTVEPASEKIEMTAPVTVEPLAAATRDALLEARRWRVQFVMPREHSLQTLPRPNNPAVDLREVPGGLHAAIVFSGLARERSIGQATDELLAWLDARGYRVIGAPQLARYNPPWTLPFLRRNEVLVSIGR